MSKNTQEVLLTLLSVVASSLFLVMVIYVLVIILGTSGGAMEESNMVYNFLRGLSGLFVRGGG